MDSIDLRRFFFVDDGPAGPTPTAIKNPYHKDFGLMEFFVFWEPPSRCVFGPSVLVVSTEALIASEFNAELIATMSDEDLEAQSTDIDLNASLLNPEGCP